MNLLHTVLTSVVPSGSPFLGRVVDSCSEDKWFIMGLSNPAFWMWAAVGRFQQIINYTQTDQRDLCAGFNKHCAHLLFLLQQSKLWFPLSCAVTVNGSNNTAASATEVLWFETRILHLLRLRAGSGAGEGKSLTWKWTTRNCQFMGKLVRVPAGGGTGLLKVFFWRN